MPLGLCFCLQPLRRLCPAMTWGEVALLLRHDVFRTQGATARSSRRLRCWRLGTMACRLAIQALLLLIHCLCDLHSTNASLVRGGGVADVRHMPGSANWCSPGVLCTAVSVHPSQADGACKRPWTHVWGDCSGDGAADLGDGGAHLTQRAVLLTHQAQLPPRHPQLGGRLGVTPQHLHTSSPFQILQPCKVQDVSPAGCVKLAKQHLASSEQSLRFPP